MLLAELANGQVQDVGPPGCQERLHQHVELVAVLVGERLQKPVGDRARSLAEGLLRRCCRSPQAEKLQRRRPAKQAGAVDPGTAVLRRVVAAGHPAPERRPVGPLHQELDAGLQQLGGGSPGRGVDRREVGFAGAKRVERFDVGVVGEEYGIEVGRHVPREVGGVVDAFILVIDWVGHGAILKRARTMV